MECLEGQREPNFHSALDVRTARCFHIGRQRPGASESERTLPHEHFSHSAV